MKNIFILLILIIALASCENGDADFEDFDYTGAYFPYQFPIRTLVLGDYIYDNTNDNNHMFVISIAMGGIHENTKDREFKFEIEESLCDNILFETDGDTINILPASYYSLSSNNTITIPAGKQNGGVEVHLSDDFFNDPDAVKLSYVVPLRITEALDVDTVMSGIPSEPGADPRVVDQWVNAPKDFTMFAVKYINEYHGTYLHYGESKVINTSNGVIENTTYSEDNIVENSTSDLVTTGKTQVLLSTFLHSEVMTGEIHLILDFDGNSCSISGEEGSLYTIIGTGVFKANAYEWGNKKRNGIEISYKVTSGENTYEANDVLVIRDRGVVFESYTPAVF